MSIQEQLFRILGDHKKLDQEIKAFILGPEEHAALWEELAHREFLKNSHVMSEPTGIFGVPIVLKASPGIDIQISKDLSLNLLRKK